MNARIFYFATRNATLDLAKHLDKNGQFKYYYERKVKETDEAYLTMMNSLAEYKSLGSCPNRQKISNPAFLILPAEDSVQIERRMTKLGPVVQVPHHLNPNSLVWQPSGFYDEKRLIAGEINSLHSSTAAKEIFNTIKSAMRRAWRKVGAYYVSPDIFEIDDIRLISIHVDEDSIYDLDIEKYKQDKGSI